MLEDLTALLRQRLDVSDIDSAQAINTNVGQEGNRKDILAFASFLRNKESLEILLFYKDVERFSGLFSDNERRALAKKIYDTYIKAGARCQMMLMGIDTRKFQEALASPDDAFDDVFDDMFEAAQQEVFELLLLDHYPHFLDSPTFSSSCEQPVASSPSLADVLSLSNRKANASFFSFAREEFCEEAVSFWLEAKSFKLLFRQCDLDERAKRICDTYIDESAPSVVNLSGSVRDAIQRSIADNHISNTLYVPAQDEVSKYLELDVLPRYLDWKSRLPSVQPIAQAGNPTGLRNWRRRSTAAAMETHMEIAKERMKELLSGPKANVVRAVAREIDALESVEFWLKVQNFKLYFTPFDRLKAARSIFFEYLDAGSRNTLAVSDDAYKQARAHIDFESDTTDATDATFALAEKDTLALITENMYQACMHRLHEIEQEAHDSKRADEKKVNFQCKCTIF